MLTQVSSNLRPATSTSCRRIGAGPSCITGISSACNHARPIFTRTRSTVAEVMAERSACNTPAPVSIASAPSLGVIPTRSTRYLVKQRNPLPHISPSDPSELTITIRAAATSVSCAIRIPSAPTPKCRSQIRGASPDQSISLRCALAPSASINRKSLPAPCTLRNGMDMLTLRRLTASYSSIASGTSAVQQIAGSSRRNQAR